jgi:DNA-binding PadR family transcriptional regulator
MSAGKPSQLTPAGYQVLLALAGGKAHGYAVMRFIDAATDGTVRLGPGTLYRTIARLVADGLVEETDGARTGARRRDYRLTELGFAAAQRESVLLAKLVDLATDAGLLPGTSRQADLDS